MWRSPFWRSALSPEAATLRFSALGEYVLDPAGATVDTSAGVRVDLFGAALRMFAERPIIGNGTGSFASFAAGTVGLTDLPYPHNIVLQVGADFGLLGLGLVALLVASALFREDSGGSILGGRALTLCVSIPREPRKRRFLQ